MDTDSPRTPSAPDHGPDDHVLVRLLRALAAPLRARPDADVRRSHVAAASAAARGDARGAVAPTRARRRFALPGLARPVLAGGLALSLVASLVVATGVLPDGLRTRGADEPFEIAMAFGFTPSSIPLERTEDHVILTVDADRAEAVGEELARLLATDPTVLSVRTDRTAFTVPASIAAQLEVSDAVAGAEVETVADTPVFRTSTVPVTQSPVPSWGLDRIDAGKDDDPLDGRYRFVATGSGVRVYVIDTGVRSDHADLGGRVLPGWSAIDDGRGAEDCNGHGTHVAGTVAGASFGVAKSASIVPVRVLDCNGGGFASSVVAGISWVIANHPGGPGVINLSLGGPANSAIDRAVADAAARGLTVVAAAGNEGGDACAVSPARSASAVTIGATTSRDARASYSNFGPCVDMFAPGSGITSAWHTGAGASATLSGTSMAAPHVAGIAARLLEVEPGASPSRVSSLLTGAATSDAVSGSDGSANLLLNLVDFEEEIDCEALLDELEEGDTIPEDCLEEICELLEEQGAELPEECLDDDERDEDEDERDDDEDERERDGEGRPDAPPGLGGVLPPGFGGPVPGLERAPGLVGRTPPGLVDGVPPGLVPDVVRVNGFSFDGAGATLSASWRATGAPDAFVLECSAGRPGPSWSTDLTIRFAADALGRSGDRFSVGLAGAVDGMTRCRVAAEADGVLGVRSNASTIPLEEEDDGDDTESPEAGTEGDAGRPAVPGAPAVPGPPADAGRPAVPGAPAAPGGSTAPSTPNVPGPPATAGPPTAGPPPSVGTPPGRPELNPSGRVPGPPRR